MYGVLLSQPYSAVDPINQVRMCALNTSGICDQGTGPASVHSTAVQRSSCCYSQLFKTGPSLLIALSIMG